MDFPLLTRDEFRRQVMARSHGRCCVPGCGCDAVDAHHIIDRTLFDDGGYYLCNGAALCGDCHMAAERTDISVENLREWLGIKSFILPPQFIPGEKIDKWGNGILSNGMRTKGELFFQEGVQKILKGKLDLFTSEVKYPRTWHHPLSQGAASDDKRLNTISQFDGKRVVVTIKKDGENATMMRDCYHARSIDGKHHPSRDWIKAFWASISSLVKITG